jgi:hypothetical protein
MQIMVKPYSSVTCGYITKYSQKNYCEQVIITYLKLDENVNNSLNGDSVNNFSVRNSLCES